MTLPDPHAPDSALPTTESPRPPASSAEIARWLDQQFLQSQEARTERLDASLRHLSKRFDDINESIHSEYHSLASPPAPYDAHSKFVFSLGGADLPPKAA